MNEDPDVPPEFDGRDVHHTHHDPDERGALSTTVIEAIAAVAGIDPSRTRIPIDQSVNPDALDRLFERPVDEAEEGASLVFPVWGYTVVVHADGNVFVHESGELGDEVHESDEPHGEGHEGDEPHGEGHEDDDPGDEE